MTSLENNYLYIFLLRRFQASSMESDTLGGLSFDMDVITYKLAQLFTSVLL